MEQIAIAQSWRAAHRFHTERENLVRVYLPMHRHFCKLFSSPNQILNTSDTSAIANGIACLAYATGRN